MSWWRPDKFEKKIPYLKARAEILRAVREFFDARGYLEVDTPALQTAPCMEAHIQAFKTEIISADRAQRQTMYLHTSPEFAMKKLLVAGLPKVYQLAKTFRNAEGSRWHSPEFTMLEWYQAGMTYEEMMEETVALLHHIVSCVPPRRKPGSSCAASAAHDSYPAFGIKGLDPGFCRGGTLCDPFLPWEKLTVVEALKKYADIDIEKHLNDLSHLRAEAARIGVHVSDHDDWDNAILKIMMDKVEPCIGTPAPTIIYDYPVSMAALSRAKPTDPRFAERFEVYVCGIELANAFGELTDAKIQRERFLHEVALRKKTYGDDYPVDEDFLKAIEHGLPDSSGNALGIDRLVMLLTGAAHIDLVQAAPVQEG